MAKALSGATTVPVRDSDWSACARWLLRLNQAIGTAMTIPRTTAPARPISASQPSNAMWAPSGKRSAPRTSSNRIPHAPTAKPSNPPTKVRRTVSIITCLTTCARLAPIERRIAISFARPLARMRRRFTKLTAPMSSRKNTPACISQRVGRMDRTCSACNGLTSDRKPAAAIIFASELSSSTAALCASIWACASVIVAPGFKRAIMCVTPPPEWRAFGPRSSIPDFIGRKTRASDERKRKAGGKTPTIFLGIPFMRVSRPKMFGSELKRWRQKASVKIVTFFCGSVSSSVKLRPIAGLTPRVVKNSGEMRTISSCCMEPGSPTVSALSIYMERAETVGDPGSMQQEEIVRISPEFFTTLGVSPAIGRNFTDEETDPQKNVIILTDAFWRQRFNSDPNILGRDTRINGIPRKIVGVLPPAFRFLSSEARVFLPIKSDMEQRGPKARHSGGGVTHMIARLKPGATIMEAQDQIDAHNAAEEEHNPEEKMMAAAVFQSLVRPLHAEHVQSEKHTSNLQSLF